MSKHNCINLRGLPNAAKTTFPRLESAKAGEVEQGRLAGAKLRATCAGAFAAPQNTLQVAASILLGISRTARPLVIMFVVILVELYPPDSASSRPSPIRRPCCAAF